MTIQQPPDRRAPSAPVASPSSSREKILEAAEAAFAQRGYAGVGMQSLAVASGLRKSSLFHHFRSKPQLYCEVVSRLLERIEERLAPVMRSAAEPLERLDHLIDCLVDALAEHPTTARLLLRALFEEDELPKDGLPELEAAERKLAAIIESIRRLLSAGVESGVFRRISVAHTLQSLIGATVYHFASGEIGDELLGKPVMSSEAVNDRKRELKQFFRAGMIAVPAGAPDAT